MLNKPIRQQDLMDCLTKLFSARMHEAHPGQADHPAPNPPQAASRRPAAASPLYLLLAEDNKINQQFAVALLGKAGHRTDVAENGHQAVDAVRRIAYDAVLMDIQMPELDGVEATKQIRALPPPACLVYIIALTANAMQGARAEYLAAGMDDYISKPIDGKLLLTKLAELSAKKKPVVRPPEAPAPQRRHRTVDGRKNAPVPDLPVLDAAKLAELEDGHARRRRSRSSSPCFLPKPPTIWPRSKSTERTEIFPPPHARRMDLSAWPAMSVRWN